MKIVLVGKFQLQIESGHGKPLSEGMSLELPVDVHQLPGQYYAEGNISWNLLRALENYSTVKWKRDEGLRNLTHEIEKMVQDIAKDLAHRLIVSEDIQQAIVIRVTEAVALELNRRNRI